MKLKAKRQKTITELMETGREIDAALRKGTRAALLAHMHAGNSVYGVVDGRARWVKPAEIEKILNQSAASPKPRRRASR